MLISGAIGIVLVGFAEWLGAAKTYAARAGYDVNPDRELIGLGRGEPGRAVARLYRHTASRPRHRPSNDVLWRTGAGHHVAAGAPHHRRGRAGHPPYRRQRCDPLRTITGTSLHSRSQDGRRGLHAARTRHRAGIDRRAHHQSAQGATRRSRTWSFCPAWRCRRRAT
jgi:hypothetical protein